MNENSSELLPEKLRWTCDASLFSFKTTAEIPPLKGIVEQERPVRAIRFGLDITSPGYNIYVSGLTGTGKTTVIKTFLEEIAARMPCPDDWCYVHNFRDPNCPTILNLPAGRAKVLKAEMDDLVHHLKAEIPKAFESKEYEESVNSLLRENQMSQQTLLNRLSEKARKEGFDVEITKVGVSLLPILDGKPVTSEQYEQLGQEDKDQIEQRRSGLDQEIQVFLRQMRDVNKESRDKISELHRRVGLYVVGIRMEGIAFWPNSFFCCRSALPAVAAATPLRNALRDGRWSPLVSEFLTFSRASFIDTCLFRFEGLWVLDLDATTKARRFKDLTLH